MTKLVGVSPECGTSSMRRVFLLPLELFMSYSVEDVKLQEKLETHLVSLQRQDIVKSWCNRKIAPGTDWKSQIDKHLEEAGIILLLVSADFMASDYLWGVELKRAMERHDSTEARVIPVLLRPADILGTPFARLKALPENAKPVTTWRNRDAAFLGVVKGIRDAVVEMAGNTESEGVHARVNGAQVGHGTSPRPSGLTTCLDVRIDGDFSENDIFKVANVHVQIFSLYVSSAEIVGIRKGSVFLTLKLTKEDGNRLQDLIRDKKLKLQEFELSVNDDIGKIIENWKALLWDEDPSVRGSAAGALGRIGPGARDAVPELIDTLWDEDLSVRGSAAEALGRIGPGSPEAVAILVNLLKEADPLIREHASKALGLIGPHSLAITGWIEWGTTEILEAGQLLNETARYLYDRGRYTESEPVITRAMEVRREVLGEEHPDYADSLNSLATLYSVTGRYAEAEPLYLQAVNIRRTALGERHPDYAASLNGLARLYRDMGRYTDAERLHLQAVSIRREALGERHPGYAQSLNSLAALYYATSRHAEAEPLYLQAVSIRREALGERHPDYACSLNNLAVLYYATGRHAKAEPLHLQAMAIRREALGERHPIYARMALAPHLTRSR